MGSGLWQAYAAILVSALVPITAGSLDSIQPPRALRRARRRAAKLPDDSDTEDELTERLTAADALVFPFAASIALLALYYAFKYVSKEVLERLLGFYFFVVGFGGVTRMGAKAAKVACGLTQWANFSRYHFRLTRDAKVDLFSLRFTVLDLAAAATGLATCLAATFYGHWTLTNLIALSISFNAISLLRIDSFRTGCLMLILLFAYDVFWVFGTDVMVSVAMNIEGPIKISIPKEFSIAPKSFAMLGLGDIVLPGVFVALCARFDYAQALARSPGKPPLPYDATSRPYFYASLACYTLGLALTMVVMHWWDHPQPALLYLTPACIISAFATAAIRGETKAMWQYDDGAQQERDNAEAKEAKEAAKVRTSPAHNKVDLLPPAPDSQTELHTPKPLSAHEEEVTPSDADDEMTSAGEATEVLRRRSLRKRE